MHAVRNVGYNPVQRWSPVEVAAATEVVRALVDAFDPDRRRNARPTGVYAAAQQAYAQLFAGAGLDDQQAHLAANAVLRELAVRQLNAQAQIYPSAIAPEAGLLGYLPFYDHQRAQLQHFALESCFVAGGADPRVAGQLASFVSQSFAPPAFYLPYWSVLGGGGPADLERLAAWFAPASVSAQYAPELSALRSANHAGGVAAHAYKNRATKKEDLQAQKERARPAPAPRPAPVRTASPRPVAAVTDANKLAQELATRDAVALHTAISGSGTDEEKLIDILSNRSPSELAQLKSAYASMYGVPLRDAIAKDTSGSFERFLLKVLDGRRRAPSSVDEASATRDAVALHNAIAGWGTDEDTLIDVFGTRSKKELKATADAYQSMYGESLRDAVAGDASGWFEAALLAQLDKKSARPAPRPVPDAHAEPSPSDRIVPDLESAPSPSDRVVPDTVVSPSPSDRIVSAPVVSPSPSDRPAPVPSVANVAPLPPRSVRIAPAPVIDTRVEVAENEGREREARARATTVPARPTVDRAQSTRDAVALRQAVSGAGTDEAKLIEVLSRRTNSELKEIQSAYQRMYNESLKSRVASETSGSLETFLVRLLEGRRGESSSISQEDATRDAVALHTAIAGWGTDEAKLVEVFGSRSRAQLAKIAAAYRGMYGETLKSAVQGDVSGNFESALVAQLP